MLAGDEKRIRALFSELVREDQRGAPRFTEMWQRSVLVNAPVFNNVRESKWPSLKFNSGRLLLEPISNGLMRGQRYATSPVIITAALIAIALLSLALWSNSREGVQTTQETVSIAVDSSTPVIASTPGDVTDAYSKSKPKRYRPTARRRTRTAAKENIVQKAAIIWSWDSPTAALLESPADPLLKSLPLVNQSARELESFLPNDAGKESNQ